MLEMGDMIFRPQASILYPLFISNQQEHYTKNLQNLHLFISFSPSPGKKKNIKLSVCYTPDIRVLLLKERLPLSNQGKSTVHRVK